MLLYWIIVGALIVTSLVLHLAGAVRFDSTLHWTAWLVVGLVLLVGGFMAFDGGRALLTGDYITPQRGRFAGRLGPWSGIVEAVGVDPRSSVMKSTFLLYGLLYVGAAAAWVLGASRAWLAVLLMAVLGLWYVPFGTLLNAIAIVLLVLPPLRSA